MAITMVSNNTNIISIPAQSPYSLHSIPRSTSAKIEDQQGKLVAVGALIRYTNNQAYFILQHLDPNLAEKAVTVSKSDNENSLDMRIDQIFNNHPDRTFMPMFIQVHYNPEERLILEHLIDQLSEHTLGRYNLELRKNITIDVFDSDSDRFLRNNAGFIVADKLRLQQITVKTSEALKELKPSKEVNVIKVNKEDHELLIEYDATLSSHNRAEFLEFIFAKNRVYAAKLIKNEIEKEIKENDKENNKINEQKIPPLLGGYLVASNEIVMCIYANNQAIADSLLLKYMEDSKFNYVKMCSTALKWQNIRKVNSIKLRSIYRRHTRTVPTNLKYERIFAFNVGMNIF
ncbi:hypothetical protein Mgra_00000546 [Meloidogyne graminicola]|uniref:DUF7596 domain-containing protein n=1 Tax=Meloidogyne graminicola TaxID=189291 RepID=A0A8T0A3H0_9BILA|nr:hypothetical protein Mgra_00000546 [Meloidogyne graminicola]